MRRGVDNKSCVSNGLVRASTRAGVRESLEEARRSAALPPPPPPPPVVRSTASPMAN